MWIVFLRTCKVILIISIRIQELVDTVVISDTVSVMLLLHTYYYTPVVYFHMKMHVSDLHAISTTNVY